MESTYTDEGPSFKGPDLFQI